MRFKDDRIRTKLKRLFSMMVYNCYKSKHGQRVYDSYKRKGIKICKEWLNNSEEFINWSLSNGYRENLVLNRIDFQKDYSPDNCRYILKSMVSGFKLEVDGTVDSYRGWDRKFNLSLGTVSNWIKRYGIEETKYRIRDYLKNPYKKFSTEELKIDNRILRLSTWSKIIGIDYLFLCNIYNLFGKDSCENLLKEFLEERNNIFKEKHKSSFFNLDFKGFYFYSEGDLI